QAQPRTVARSGTRSAPWGPLAVVLVLLTASLTGAGAAAASVTPPTMTAAASNAALAPPAVIARYDGVNEYDQDLCRSCYNSADTQIAVGDHQVVQQVGSELFVYTKPSNTELAAGVKPRLLSMRTQAQLLDLDRLNEHALNGRLLYDPDSRRYVISDMSEDHIAVAVFATDDATGAWYLWRQSIPHNSIDEPKLTITTDKILFGSYGKWWVLQKSDVLAATTSPMTPRFSIISTDIDTYGTDTWSATSTGTADAYLERALQKSVRGYGMDGIAVLTVTGTPAAGDLRVTHNDLTLTDTETQNPPTSAPQPHAHLDQELGPIKAEVYSAAWADDRLWIAAVDSCTTPGASPTPSSATTASSTTTRSAVTCIRVVEIDTSRPDAPSCCATSTSASAPPTYCSPPWTSTPPAPSASSPPPPPPPTTPVSSPPSSTPAVTPQRG
ncbi:MAG: hypothetical protein ACRYF3_01395, partial [Janthinobacterium lividum]